jgi:hypothetical protein
MRRIRSHLSYANVMATIAVFITLGGGTAVALNGSNTVFSDDIANDNFNSPTQGQGGLVAADLRANAVGSSEIAANAVGGSEIAGGVVGTGKIAPNAVGDGQVVEFSLSNNDVGVLFAQVNADGTLANSSGGVTASKQSTGTYEVDFGHDISSCAFVTTEGDAGLGGAVGAITGNTDRVNNSEATYTTTRTAAGALADRAFQQVVVC